MIGFYARGDSTKPVRVDLDKELLGDFFLPFIEHFTEETHKDARWFTRQEIKAVLDHPSGSFPPEGRAAKGNVVDEPPFKLPPVTTMAGILIRDWIKGKLNFQPADRQEGIFKGNL